VDGAVQGWRGKEREGAGARSSMAGDTGDEVRINGRGRRAPPILPLSSLVHMHSLPIPPPPLSPRHVALNSNSVGQ
jgi:hypothetical protein